MKIEETNIPGLKLVHLKELKDNRGSFIKTFNFDFFTSQNLEVDFKESYYSISSKNVIRGMHFQVPPAEHTKLVYVNQGAIKDVILDIRHNSPAYGQYFSVSINTASPVLIYIPAGCAHGFLSLEENTMVTYLQTTCYNNDFDKGIKYDSFGMDWGISNPILSNRDLEFPGFSETDFVF
jgi:dTDP-4-dehydrorhamnose 3,5-epimerase